MATRADDLTDILLRHQVLLQRLTAGEQRKFLPFLREIDADLRKRLGARELTQLTRQRIEKLLKAVDEMLTEILGQFQNHLFDSLNDIAKNETAFSGRALNVIVDIDAALPSVGVVRAAVLANPLSIKNAPLLKPFVKAWTQAQRKAVGGAIRAGVFQGQTNAQIVLAIRGTRAKRYEDGLLDTTTRHANTLVHTAVQHVSSQARQATFQENADIVKEVRWISTLDQHTCQTCRSLDQRRFAINKGPRPPIHPNDRCTIVPVLADKFAALMAGGERPSVGQSGVKLVSAQLDYYSWLKAQPASFVQSTLGTKRAAVFLRGGISVDRFAAMQLDRYWRPISLEEMKSLEPLAFERAGL